MPLAEQTVEHWQEILRINLIGPFLAIKYAMPHMIRQKHGAIVCTASVAGLKSGASGHPYAASKAGVISLVQTTAYSFFGSGVRVNAICPGLIETGMTKPIFDYARGRGTEANLGQLNPLTRFGVPQEIAAMAAFLASDEASYVNGQAIAITGREIYRTCRPTPGSKPRPRSPRPRSAPSTTPRSRPHPSPAQP